MYGEDTKVYVYQMGKVASSSIRLTLRDLDGIEVAHAHYLSYENSIYTNELKRSLGWKKVSLNPENVRESCRILNTESYPKIISLVREPISRNISAFFQTLDYIVGTTESHNKFTLQELADIFFRQYPHEIPLTWFDREFQEVLDIDVYQYPFPKNKGFFSINKGKYQVLVMRYDLPDSEKASNIESLIGVENLSIRSKNIATSKPYAEVYRDFKDFIKFPSSYVDTMLDSKYALHFYSEEELELVRDTWI